MRKNLFVVSLIVVASLVLAACGAQAPAGMDASDMIASLTAMAAQVTPLKQGATQTPWVVTATPEGSWGTQVSPTKIEVPAATLVPTATSGPQLRTAAQVRAFFKLGTLKWVSGGEGSHVAGGQGELVNDLVLKDMPEGMVFEYQCVQYHTLGGEVIIEKVCPGATVKFTEVIPAHSVGTAWLGWAVQGSSGETFPEGFKNAPCLCQDGDCRDE